MNTADSTKMLFLFLLSHDLEYSKDPNAPTLTFQIIWESCDLKINHYSRARLQIKNQFLLSNSYILVWVKNLKLNRFDYNLDWFIVRVGFFHKFYKEISFWWGQG